MPYARVRKSQTSTSPDERIARTLRCRYNVRTETQCGVAMYQVESDVPAPVCAERANSMGRVPKYPFGVMAVGDSFAADVEEWDRLRYAASRFGRREGKKFSVRKVDDRSVRVWRMA